MPCSHLLQGRDICSHVSPVQSAGLVQPWVAGVRPKHYAVLKTELCCCVLCCRVTVGAVGEHDSRHCAEDWVQG